MTVVNRSLGDLNEEELEQAIDSLQKTLIEWLDANRILSGSVAGVYNFYNDFEDLVRDAYRDMREKDETNPTKRLFARGFRLWSDINKPRR